MKKIFDILCSKNIVLGSGFMIGFVYEFKFEETTLKYPLSTIGNSCINGFITYSAAHILYGLLPLPVTAIIPITAGASCAYYKYNDIFNKPASQEIGNKKD